MQQGCYIIPALIFFSDRSTILAILPIRVSALFASLSQKTYNLRLEGGKFIKLLHAAGLFFKAFIRSSGITIVSSDLVSSDLVSYVTSVFLSAPLNADNPSGFIRPSLISF